MEKCTARSYVAGVDDIQLEEFTCDLPAGHPGLHEHKYRWNVHRWEGEKIPCKAICLINGNPQYCELPQGHEGMHSVDYEVTYEGWLTIEWPQIGGKP
jgi:hypothetical protein